MAATYGADEAKAIAEQRAELVTARTLESDLDLAFRLQLEEAMAASVSLLPSSSSTSAPKPPQISAKNGGEAFNFADVQSKELDKLEQELRDREFCEKEAMQSREDLYRRIHDQKVALDIVRMPDDDWEDFGDEFERPFGEGSSSSAPPANVNFRLYFKGLVSVERVGGSDVTLTGIGVAICDPRDNLIFQLSKPLLGNGMSRQVTEIKALIEGLETAMALDLKRITFFCDYPTVYQYARQVWQPKGRKMAILMEKVKLLRKKFTHCHPSLVARSDMKFAFKLARDAIVSQMSKPAESNDVRVMKETCVICVEETDQDKMFTIDGCLHKFCFSCMRQHVEAKLYIGMIPKCPHESCKSELNVISCDKFLTPKAIEIMKQRIREASIPVAEKVYCPYPRCSALMSKSEIFDFARKENVRDITSGAGKCMKCNSLLCINCKAPWHKNMTCAEYRRSTPPQPEEKRLISLATNSLWRQCKECKYMIELAEGCYHMTCRCGYEFCYICGAEWKNKKATCSCRLWDEENILFYDTDFDEEDDDDFDDSFSDSDSDWY